MLSSVGDKNAFAGICTLSEYFPSSRLIDLPQMCVSLQLLAWRRPTANVVGLHQQGLPTLSQLSTGMGDRVRVQLPEAALYFGM